MEFSTKVFKKLKTYLLYPTTAGLSKRPQVNVPECCLYTIFVVEISHNKLVMEPALKNVRKSMNKENAVYIHRRLLAVIKRNKQHCLSESGCNWR